MRNPIRLLQNASESVFTPATPAPPAARRVRRGVIPRPAGMSAKEYEAFQLYALGEAGVTHVRLRAADTPSLPEPCAGSHGFVMTLDEAMMLQPIPHEVETGQECMCSYRPATD